jgi:putative methionine-R-sulfoxide reductase with GAF domain
MGYCLQTGEMWCYPDDTITSNKIRRIDPRVLEGEVVAPVFYNGGPSAVLLIDFFADERQTDFDGKFRERILQATRELTNILENYSSDRVSTRTNILKAVRDCLTETRSVRGYLAIKGWDGKLDYLTTDTEEQPIFLALNQTEGLCGRVFQTGDPINARNVWSEKGYVASDTAVQSEYIYPVKFKDETVAVLNMESEELDHYNDERVAIIVTSAQALKDLVEQYRKLDTLPSEAVDLQHAHVSDFIEQATTHCRSMQTISDAAIQIEITDFIVKKLMRLFDGEKQIIWTDPAQPPVEMKDLRWGERIQEGSIFLNGSESQERYLVYSPFRIDGFLKAIVGFVTTVGPPDIAKHVAEQFCRIGSSIAESTIESNRSALFELLIRDLLSKRDRRTLYEVVRLVPNIVDCDHCTILGVTTIGSEQIVVPLASSSENVFKDPYSQLYYRLKPKYDGYTGYVAVSGKPLFRYPPQDSEKTEPASEGEPPWAQKTSEGREDLAALIILPIRDSERQVTTGVLRVLRTKQHRKAPGVFERRFVQRLEMICLTLGEVFQNDRLVSAALRQKSRDSNLNSRRACARQRAKALHGRGSLMGEVTDARK